jgi:hypothetical protein
VPYFVILPIFAVSLCLEGLVLLLCVLVPSLRRAVPAGLRVLVGSVVGFVLANAASILFGVLPVLVAAVLRVDKDSPAAAVVAGFALAGLFVGPLVVSPLGFLGGAWLGLRRGSRATTQAS